MKKVPFVKNHKDNTHCVNAVFRMVHKYFFGKDLTWKEIDKLTHALPNKATWTFIGEMEFSKKGLSVTNIEPIDYLKLYDEGVGYLNKAVGKKTADYYLTKTNIASVLKYIPAYLKTVKHETRKATTKEIIKLLKQNCLIGVEINSHILDKVLGFGLHFVLLYDFDGKNIILHDPGLPPLKSRRIPIAEFEKCFHFPGAGAGITVFKRREII